MRTYLTPAQDESLQRYKRARQSLRDPIDNPTIAYAGTAGSYAEEAAIAFFGEDRRRLAHGSFADVFKSLTGGGADYGVLPIENSSTGSIAAVYDLLSHYTCSIVGEIPIEVHHCLLALPGATLEGLTEIYSHEQGFFQSQEFLSRHPRWKCVPWSNTAVAARMVADSGNRAYGAIASARAAQIHGLTILAEDINSSDINSTRFVVVSPVPERRPGRDKISLIFRLPHRTGALYRLLGIFEAHHLNLCKIESRPLPGVNWEYLFFLDFLGAAACDDLDAVLMEVLAATEQFYFLGSYPPFG